MQIILLMMLGLFASVSHATPFNVKDAFCKDKLSKYNSNYTNAKIYNHCITNADKLIIEYENERIKRRIEWEKERKKQQERMAREKRQKELEAKKREQQRKAEEYRKKLEEEKKKKWIDNLFETKFN